MNEAGFKHPLCGATLPALWGLVRRAPRVPRRAWPWLAYFALCGLARAPVTLAETALLAARSRATRAPLFIVGHWRSGTTHLVNLLAAAGRFNLPTPVSVGLPAEWLMLGRPLEPWLARLIPEGRWIDAVKVDRAAPQEDEIALANLGAPSFYEAYYLPGDFRRRLRELLFLGEAGLRAWLDRAEAYYARLERTRPDARLVIKNPVYTARVAALVERWPEARFVHCVRDPYAVFGSTLRFHRELGAALGLAPFDEAEIEAAVIETYATMMARFEADRTRLAPGRLVDVRYEELAADPLAVVERLYALLELGEFAADRPAIAAHVASVAGYRAGRYRLDEATRARLDAAWQPFIAKWAVG